MGKKHGKDDSRKINVEIAPGNQQAMDEYRAAYNGRPDRATPKIKYTDIVNEALDRFLSPRVPGKKAGPKSRTVAGEKK